MSSSRTKQAKNAGRGAAWETEKSMRRKGGQEHGRVCSEIQASIREANNHTQTLSSRAGGREARLRAT